MVSIKELLSIIPGCLRNRIILPGNRQFGTKRFMKFFGEKEIRFEELVSSWAVSCKPDT
jgi:hypothetical protein